MKLSLSFCAALTVSVLLVLSSAALAEVVKVKSSDGGQLKMKPGVVYEVAAQEAAEIGFLIKGETVNLSEAIATAQKAGMRKRLKRVLVASDPADIPGVSLKMADEIKGLGGRGIASTSADGVELECFCLPPVELYMCGWS